MRVAAVDEIGVCAACENHLVFRHRCAVVRLAAVDGHADRTALDGHTVLRDRAADAADDALDNAARNLLRVVNRTGELCAKVLERRVLDGHAVLANRSQRRRKATRSAVDILHESAAADLDRILLRRSIGREAAVAALHDGADHTEMIAARRILLPRAVRLTALCRLNL